MINKILKFMFIFALIFVLFGCNLVSVTSIEVSEYGKDTYFIDEEFDPTGYVLTLKYSDGTTKDIPLTIEMCDLSVMQNEGMHTISVTYEENGKSVDTSFDVFIGGAKANSIAVKEKGKDIYSCLVELDLSGYVFTVTYSDNTTKDVILDNSNADITTFPEVDEDTKQTINITYNDSGTILKTTIEVTVMNEWDYEDYIEELEIQEILEKIEVDCKGMIPSEAVGNIVLPSAEDYGYKLKLIWISSEPAVISVNGTVTYLEDDKNVILTLKVSKFNSSETLAEYNFDVFVKGLGPVEFEEIKEGQKLVFAYFYEGTYTEISNADAQRIDVINYCFGRISNGELSLKDLSHLQEIMQLRREQKVRIVLSIGGGGVGGFAGPCSTAAGRTKFVDSIIEAIETYNFDGIDVDWEYPGWSGLADSTPADPHNFSLLLKELRERMDAYKEGLILSAAVISSSASKFYEPKELDKYLDYVHIMTYDGNNSGIASHHTKPYGSGYSAESAIKLYSDAGVSLNKIVIGAAFYGKISELSNPTTEYNSVVGKPVLSTTTIQYTKIYNEYLTNPEYQLCYDSSCGAYFLTNGKYFITFDNADSIKAKCELIKKYDLGGMMFWDYGSDKTGSLLKSVYSGISKLNAELK